MAAAAATDVGGMSKGSNRDRSTMWKVHVGQVLVQVGFSGAYVLSKVALTTGIDPIVFAVYRDFVCLAVLLPLAFLTERGKQARFSIPLLALLAAFGFFGSYATQLLMLYGLLLTSAAYGSTISVLTPLFTFIISASFGFEHIRWKRRDGQAKVLGLLSAVSGAVVLALYMGPVVLGPADSGLHVIPLSAVNPNQLLAYASEYLQIGPWHLGIALLFLAGFTLSICISIQVPILARYPAPISVSACSYFVGSILLCMTALVTVKDSSAWVITQRPAVIAYVYNGLVPGAFNFTVLIWCVQKAGPVLISSYIPLQLFSASAMAYLFLNESIHLGTILGTLLIINGLGFITWGQIQSRNVAHLPVKTAPPLTGIPVITATSSLDVPLLGYVESKFWLAKD